MSAAVGPRAAKSEGAGRGDAGSMTVELLVLIPVLFVIIGVFVVFGRVSEAHQQVTEAARAGAEAAAVAPDPGAAQADASASAVPETSTGVHTCVHATVTTDVGAFEPGGQVSVTVVCQVDLADLAVPGLPGTTTVTATAAAPIDPYRSVA